MFHDLHIAPNYIWCTFCTYSSNQSVSWPDDFNVYHPQLYSQQCKIHPIVTGFPPACGFSTSKNRCKYSIYNNNFYDIIFTLMIRYVCSHESLVALLQMLNGV